MTHLPMHRSPARAVALMASLLVAAPLGAALFLVPLGAGADQPAMVEVTAKRFSFTPNVVTLKARAPAILRVHSEDVTHGFFSRALGIDETLSPGRTVEVPVTPAAPGRYDIICDHFCGAGHGNMKMTIVVE